MKNNTVKEGLSKIVWGIAFLPIAASLCGAGEVPAGDTLDLNSSLNDWLDVYGTLNMYPGAHVEWGIYAYGGSTVNIYAGTIGDYSFISVSDGATVTVYGTDLKLDGEPVEYGLVPIPNNTLTGKYADGSDISLWIMSSTDINLQAPGGGGPIPVEIDIKPGSYPNPINPGSNGVIPVAIFTTDEFNAADVDPGTVTLAGAKVAVRGKSEKLMARMEDVDGDGDDDLLLQVDTQSDGAVWETGPVTLTGTTYGGDQIEGTDDVIIVPPE